MKSVNPRIEREEYPKYVEWKEELDKVYSLVVLCIPTDTEVMDGSPGTKGRIDLSNTVKTFPWVVGAHNDVMRSFQEKQTHSLTQWT